MLSQGPCLSSCDHLSTSLERCREFAASLISTRQAISKCRDKLLRSLLVPKRVPHLSVRTEWANFPPRGLPFAQNRPVQNEHFSLYETCGHPAHEWSKDTNAWGLKAHCPSRNGPSFLHARGRNCVVSFLCAMIGQARICLRGALLFCCLLIKDISAYPPRAAKCLTWWPYLGQVLLKQGTVQRLRDQPSNDASGEKPLFVHKSMRMLILFIYQHAEFPPLPASALGVIPPK